MLNLRWAFLFCCECLIISCHHLHCLSFSVTLSVPGALSAHGPPPSGLQVSPTPFFISSSSVRLCFLSPPFLSLITCCSFVMAYLNFLSLWDSVFVFFFPSSRKDQFLLLCMPALCSSPTFPFIALVLILFSAGLAMGCDSFLWPWLWKHPYRWGSSAWIQMLCLFWCGTPAPQMKCKLELYILDGVDSG